MILQIKKLAIIEDASPDNVVNLVPVTEGPEGAAVFGISNEHEQFFIEDRQTYVDRSNPTLEIAVLKPDTADITQLESWVNNQTDVYISAYTLDGGYFFGDIETSVPFKLLANEQLSDNDLFMIKAQKQTTSGFDPSNGLHEGGFWAGENLIGGYEWADNDGDNVADGWSESGYTSTSFSSGQQTLTYTGIRTFTRNIYFPFEGAQVTFSFNVDTYNTTDNFVMQVRGLDSSGSLVDNSTTVISSSGRKSATHTIQATTVTIVCYIQTANDTTGTEVSQVISDPCLRIGTGTTYTKF